MAIFNKEYSNQTFQFLLAWATSPIPYENLQAHQIIDENGNYLPLKLGTFRKDLSVHGVGVYEGKSESENIKLV